MISNVRFHIPIGARNLLKVIAALLVMFSHYFNVKASMGADLNPVEWLVRSQGGNIGVPFSSFCPATG